MNWQYYPKSIHIPEHLKDVIDVFVQHEEDIKSPDNELPSNQVLSLLTESLVELGFDVEKSKKTIHKIMVPVLFGRNGRLEKSFEADAVHFNKRTVLEVEAGRGVTNYQLLKDLFQACMMQDIDYLATAVRNRYKSNQDFETVLSFFDALHASGRLRLPLSGVLVIGY